MIERFAILIYSAVDSRQSEYFEMATFRLRCSWTVRVDGTEECVFTVVDLVRGEVVWHPSAWAFVVWFLA